jgi:D-arabinose 1-dehydrogenase-like Zn-dependent alcohol dehydrogenase
MATMRAVQVSTKGGPLELVERDIPSPARGQLIVAGAAGDPISIPAAALIGDSKSIAGHASGTSRDSEDTLAFSALTDVRPMIETMPLEDAQAAYDKMMAGDARFRMVLTIS